MRYLLLILIFYCMPLMAEQAVDDVEQSTIEQRIKPIGQVTTEEQEKKQATSGQVKPAEPQKLTAEKIVQQYCSVCHKTGVSGAPKIGDETAWQPFVTSAKKLEGLVKIAIAGKGAMPPKGTCNDCSEKDIQAAILYMLPEKFKKIK